MTNKQVTKGHRAAGMALVMVPFLLLLYWGNPSLWHSPKYVIALGLLVGSSIAAAWIIPKHRLKWMAIAAIVGGVVSNFIYTTNLAVVEWTPLALGGWLLLSALAIAYWPRSRVKR